MEIENDGSFTLAVLRNEFQGYLAGLSRELREGGIASAPYAVLSLAKCLAWNADKLDNAPALIGQVPTTPSIAALADELKRAALALCNQQTKPATPATYCERVVTLEQELAAVRALLANRKGEPQ